ncbi:MAG: isoprenylcysteine carboxylmethyltransferase family protein [Bacteroidota bacterium]
MALAEQFEQSGNRLFRNRSFIPAVLFVAATVAILIDKNQFIHFQVMWWNILCLLISIKGLLIRAFTIGYTPGGTSGRNTKEGQIAEVLNTKGIYSIVRHPLYLGNFFMWFGIILYTAIPWLIVFSLAFFWLYYERIMFAEEQFIRKKFGQSFIDWSSKTPAFIPDIRLYQKADLPFSLKNVLKREYSGLFAMIFSFAYLNALNNFVQYRHVYLDLKWQIAGIAGLLIYITLRTLKKSTKILNTEGR